jgi:hypothetical protein
MNRPPVPRLAALAAAMLVTVGAAIPLTMMVHGSLALDITYKWWTWPAIPAVWAPALAGALVAMRHQGSGAVLLAVAAAPGSVVFVHELGLFTFAPAWVLAAYLYFDAGRRRGLIPLGPPAVEERPA